MNARDVDVFMREHSLRMHSFSCTVEDLNFNLKKTRASKGEIFLKVEKAVGASSFGRVS
jgi:hypothetical protein